MYTSLPVAPSRPETVQSCSLPAPTRLKIAVVGQGKMAYDCLSRLSARPEADSVIAITRAGAGHSGARLAGLCSANSIELIDTPDPNGNDVLGRLSDCSPDVIFNVNSFSILREPIRAIPSMGIVNFHNGPLPRYAGLNIPTWAIWNAETTHGVAWHFVDESIDGGNLLCQASFPIKTDETAASLMFKCIVEGIRLFDEAFDRLVAGERVGQPQFGDRSYFGRQNLPNDGYVDLGWDNDTMQRFLRAFDHRPFVSLGPQPRLRTAVGEIQFCKARICPLASTRRAAIGTVLAASEEHIQVQAAAGILMIESIVDEAGSVVPLDVAAGQNGVLPGSSLPAFG